MCCMFDPVGSLVNFEANGRSKPYPGALTFLQQIADLLNKAVFQFKLR